MKIVFTGAYANPHGPLALGMVNFKLLNILGRTAVVLAKIVVLTATLSNVLLQFAMARHTQR